MMPVVAANEQNCYFGKAIFEFSEYTQISSCGFAPLALDKEGELDKPVTECSQRNDRIRSTKSCLRRHSTR